MAFPRQRVVYGTETDTLSGDFGTVTVPATITPADLLAVLTSLVFGGPQGPPPTRIFSQDKIAQPVSSPQVSTVD